MLHRRAAVKSLVASSAASLLAGPGPLAAQSAARRSNDRRLDGTISRP